MRIIHFFFFGLGIFLLNSCKSNTYQVQSALILKNLETENKLYQSSSKDLIGELHNRLEAQKLGGFILQDTLLELFEPLLVKQKLWADTAAARQLSGKNLIAQHPNIQDLGKDISKLKNQISAFNEQFFAHLGLDTSKKTERAYYQPRIDTLLQTAFSALQTPLFEFENLDAEALRVSLAILKTEIWRVQTELLQIYLAISKFEHGYDFAELVFFPDYFYEQKDSISLNIDLLYSNQYYDLDTLEINGQRFAYTDNKQLFKLRTDKIGEQIVSVKAYFSSNIFGERISLQRNFMYEVTP